jgi:hypothetical protein
MMIIQQKRGCVRRAKNKKKVTNFSYPCSVDPGEGPQK